MRSVCITALPTRHATAPLAPPLLHPAPPSRPPRHLTSLTPTHPKSPRLTSPSRTAPLHLNCCHLTSPRLASPGLTLVHLTSRITPPHPTSPHRNPRLNTPNIASCDLASPKLAARQRSSPQPHVIALHLTAPPLTAPHLTAPHASPIPVSHGFRGKGWPWPGVVSSAVHRTPMGPDAAEASAEPEETRDACPRRPANSTFETNALLAHDRPPAEGRGEGKRGFGDGEVEGGGVATGACCHGEWLRGEGRGGSGGDRMVVVVRQDAGLHGCDVLSLHPGSSLQHPTTHARDDSDLDQDDPNTSSLCKRGRSCESPPPSSPCAGPPTPSTSHSALTIAHSVAHAAYGRPVPS